MSPAEISAHVENLKPEAGQVGFADAQGRYEAAQRAAAAEVEARQADPAAWAARNAPSLAGSLSALGSGDAAAARRQAGAYGQAQLQMQARAGVESANRRLLPKATATALVEAAANNPDQAQGLIGLGQVVQAFAPPPGASGETIAAATARQRMVLNELKAAGAENGDLAAALELAGDPVRMGRYVAARRSGALENLVKRDRDALVAATDAALAPYLRSFEGLSPGAVVTGGRRQMAHRLAAQALAGGASPREAAQAGAEVLSDRYVFVGTAGFRMPATLARQRDGGPTGTHNQTLAQRGAARLLVTLGRNDGEGFYAPANSQGRNLSEDQRRERYADSVTTSGRWMTTPDDRGVVLMHPTLDGRWTPALDRDGQPIQKTFGQLIDSGRERRPSGQGAGGNGAPRGIRNNNPGNIEARETRWQGQAGSDGRFAKFTTPEHGLRALSRDMQTKMGRGLTSVRSILNTYSPPSENNTAAYIAAVSRVLGVSPDARLDPNDVQMRVKLMAAIIQHENGQQPYTNVQLTQGARAGMGR